MTDKERIMDKLYGAVAGLFLVYGISTEEYVGKNIIDLLNEAEKQFQFKEQECEELKRRIKELLHDCNSCNFHKYKQAIEPFQDEYFKGLDTKQIAELAKKSIRLTTENRKLENKLSDIAGICSQILDGEDYVRRIAKTILDIID